MRRFKKKLNGRPRYCALEWFLLESKRGNCLMDVPYVKKKYLIKRFYSLCMKV